MSLITTYFIPMTALKQSLNILHLIVGRKKIVSLNTKYFQDNDLISCGFSAMTIQKLII